MNPETLTITNVAALVSVAVVGLKLVHSVTKIGVRVDLLWERVFGNGHDRDN